MYVTCVCVCVTCVFDFDFKIYLEKISKNYSLYSHIHFRTIKKEAFFRKIFLSLL